MNATAKVTNKCGVPFVLATPEKLSRTLLVFHDIPSCSIACPAILRKVTATLTGMDFVILPCQPLSLHSQNTFKCAPFKILPSCPSSLSEIEECVTANSSSNKAFFLFGIDLLIQIHGAKPVFEMLVSLSTRKHLKLFCSISHDTLPEDIRFQLAFFFKTSLSLSFSCVGHSSENSRGLFDFKCELFNWTASGKLRSSLEKLSVEAPVDGSLSFTIKNISAIRDSMMLHGFTEEEPSFSDLSFKVSIEAADRATKNKVELPHFKAKNEILYVPDKDYDYDEEDPDCDLDF